MPIGGVGKAMVPTVSGSWKETELQENLDNVAEAVGNLHKMANDIRGELEKQTQVVTRIQEKSNLNKERISQADAMATKLLWGVYM